MKLFCVLACMAVVVFAANENQYKWAEDFTSVQTDLTEIAQGASSKTDTEVCCLTTSPQCKVEVEDQTGKVWVSVKNQAQRFDVSGEGSVITLLNENPQRQYDVVAAANGSLVCQAQCPLEQAYPPLTAGFLPINATYMGKAAYPGNANSCPAGGCDKWQVKQVILGIIVMEVDDFYVFESATQGIPVAAVSHMTPFGEPMGMQATTWMEYKGFPTGLPASDFAFLGKKDCPPPQQGCGQQNTKFMNNLKVLQATTNYRPYSQFVTTEIRSKFNMDFDGIDNNRF